MILPRISNRPICNEVGVLWHSNLLNTRGCAFLCKSLLELKCYWVSLSCFLLHLFLDDNHQVIAEFCSFVRECFSAGKGPCACWWHAWGLSKQEWSIWSTTERHSIVSCSGNWSWSQRHHCICSAIGSHTHIWASCAASVNESLFESECLRISFDLVSEPCMSASYSQGLTIPAWIVFSMESLCDWAGWVCLNTVVMVKNCR